MRHRGGLVQLLCCGKRKCTGKPVAYIHCQRCHSGRTESDYLSIWPSIEPLTRGIADTWGKVQEQVRRVFPDYSSSLRKCAAPDPEGLFWSLKACSGYLWIHPAVFDPMWIFYPISMKNHFLLPVLPLPPSGVSGSRWDTRLTWDNQQSFPTHLPMPLGGPLARPSLATSFPGLESPGLWGCSWCKSHSTPLKILVIRLWMERVPQGPWLGWTVLPPLLLMGGVDCRSRSLPSKTG